MNSVLTVCSTKNLNPEVVQSFRENNIQVIITGSSAVTPCTLNEMNDLQGAIVCTSQHAIECLLVQNVDYKRVTGIFCLAGSTHAAARRLGIPVLGTANDAAALALEILGKGIDQITFLCSDTHRPELPHLLREQGVRLRIVHVYSIKFHFQKMDKPFDAVLFFSPNSAKAFLKQNVLPEKVTCFCIGQTTAAFLRSKTIEKIIVSPFPSQECLAKQVILFAQTKGSNKDLDYAVA